MLFNIAATISGAITHIAFYAGWPKVWAAFNLAKTVWNDNDGTDAIHELRASVSHWPGCV